MSKYQVGDKVKIKNYIDLKGSMVEEMVEQFGGKVCTISKAERVTEFDGSFFDSYEIAEDNDGSGYKYTFVDEDIEYLVYSDHQKSQHIEIPVPGGHLVAETTGGADYPSIHIFFVASGDEVEHGLCFAEVCATENPDEIRVGTYFRDCDDVKDITVFPMWTKEEDNV